MSLKQAAVSGVKWVSVSAALVALLQFVQLTVLARLLRPEDFGLMAMAMVVIGFAQGYADMGLSSAIIQRKSISREQLSSLYWLNIAAGSVIFALVVAFSPVVVFFFREPLLYRLLPLICLSLPVASAGAQFHCLLEKELRFDLVAKQEVWASVAGTGVAVASGFLDQGIWSLVWGQLAAVAVKTAMLAWVGWREWPPMFHFRRADLKGFVGFGLYQMGERSINYFNSKIDQILVGSVLGTQQLGYYNFASNLVMQPVSLVTPVITRVALPVFAKMQDDASALRQSYLRMVHMLCAVNAPLLFGLGATSTLLVPLFFGVKWAPASAIVQVLCVYGYLRSAASPVGSLLLAKGRADLGFRWNLALLFTTAPAIYFGAKHGAALGAAISMVALMICYVPASYVFLIKTLIGASARRFAVAVVKPAVLAAIMAMSVLVLNLRGDGSPAWLALEIACGALVYLALVLSFDRSMLVEVQALVVKAQS